MKAISQVRVLTAENCVLQLYQGEHHILRHLRPLSLCQESSETGLQWQIPTRPAQRQMQPLQLGFLPKSQMPSAMQHDLAVTGATSDQQSDDSAAMYTSSTGYSHSPPISPRGKRPCSVRTVAAVRTAPLSQRFARRVTLPDSPEGVDTPDKQHEVAARGEGAVRERAAGQRYGLRRLKASPRWAVEAAHLSDDSRSAGMLAGSAETQMSFVQGNCL